MQRAESSLRLTARAEYLEIPAAVQLAGLCESIAVSARRTNSRLFAGVLIAGVSSLYDWRSFRAP